MILLVVAAIVALAALVRLVRRALGRRQMALELRGDWWVRFEREFRHYAETGLQAAREAERRV